MDSQYLDWGGKDGEWEGKVGMKRKGGEGKRKEDEKKNGDIRMKRYMKWEENCDEWNGKFGKLRGKCGSNATAPRWQPDFFLKCNVLGSRKKMRGQSHSKWSHNWIESWTNWLVCCTGFILYN